MGCKILSLRITASANALGSFREVVGCMAKLNIRSKYEPKRAWFAKRHPDASGVHHSRLSDRSVELHVGMTTDDDGCVESFKDWYEAVFSRQPREDLCFVARRAVAEHHQAQAVNFKLERFRPTREHRLEFWLQLRDSPAIDFDDTF